MVSEAAVKETDFREMPPQVLAAYEDPLELDKLLDSVVFTDSDRLRVRQELLDRLVKKHGNVEVEVGGRLMPLKTRVAQFRKDFWKSMDVIRGVEEFGGKEGFMTHLALVMDPYWQKWWADYYYSDSLATSGWVNAVSCVLGARQLLWIAAQSTRRVLNLGSDRSSRVRLDAVRLAETYAIKPLDAEEASAEAIRIYSILFDSIDDTETVSSRVHRSASQTALAVSDFATGNKKVGTHTCALAIVRSLQAYGSPKYVNYLIKTLITPTLITSASR